MQPETRMRCGGVALGIALSLMACGPAGTHLDVSCPLAGDRAVVEVLKPIRQEHGVPAIAGAIVTSRGLEACGVVGVRKSGTPVPATLDDQWHLGSDTKAMTAVLVGSLVDQGLLEWDTPVAEVFPELSSVINPEMKEVTVLHLLSHRSGLPENPGFWTVAWAMTGREAQRRRNGRRL